jgi:hypothetical protein
MLDLSIPWGRELGPSLLALQGVGAVVDRAKLLVLVLTVV